MPEVIGVYDGGSTVIKVHGRPTTVGVIIFRTSTNESAPVDHIGKYKLCYKESIIKNLKRLEWDKPEPPHPSDCGVDATPRSEEKADQ